VETLLDLNIIIIVDMEKKKIVTPEEKEEESHYKPEKRAQEYLRKRHEKYPVV